MARLQWGVVCAVGVASVCGTGEKRAGVDAVILEASVRRGETAYRAGGGLPSRSGVAAGT